MSELSPVVCHILTRSYRILKLNLNANPAPKQEPLPYDSNYISGSPPSSTQEQQETCIAAIQKETTSKMGIFNSSAVSARSSVSSDSTVDFDDSDRRRRSTTRTSLSGINLIILPPNTRHEPTLLALPKEIQRQIFFYVLINSAFEHCIEPYYKQGMLARGPWHDPWKDSPTDFENRDHGIIRVCKAFHPICTDLIYGLHQFKFADTELLRWWLGQIGPQNVPKIKSLMLSIGSGFIYSRQKMKVSDMSQEESWYSVLCYLGTRHNLEHLEVKFCNWSSFGQHTSQEEDIEMGKYRQQIYDKLRTRYRGMKTAYVITCLSTKFGRHDKDILRNEMLESRLPIPVQRKLTLMQMLEKAESTIEERRSREEQEIEEERLWKLEEERRRTREREHQRARKWPGSGGATTNRSIRPPSHFYNTGG